MPSVRTPAFAAPRRRPRRLARVAAAALFAAVLAGCGGSGGGNGAGTPSGGGTTGGLPTQTGCAFHYTLTTSTVLTGTDPQLATQWYLSNTGVSGGIAGEDLRAFDAWATTRGGGVRIAVVDDAIETLHPDLAPNVVTGASYNYRSGALGSAYPLPCASDETHGTSVAGVAAARDGNAIGGAGVAPRASLVGYNALSTGFDADLADALNRASADNGVYNSSWGSPDDGRVNAVSASVLAAIDNGISTGRGGKGSVFVFPGGNGGCYTLDERGQCRSESAGLDGYLNHRGVIPVCAVDAAGRSAPYAEPGANVLVCAPSSSDSGPSIFTTAVQAAYRDDFGGTSATVPMVSGVVALMLSANAELTWRDVRRILAKTARRNDPTNAGWTNAYGLWFNHKYGFGVVDAAAAVAAAKTWSSVGGSATLKSCGPYTGTPRVALPDANGALVTPREDALAVTRTDCAITEIEYVEVAFTATHAYSGDLRVRLTSPAGLVSELVGEHVCEGSGDACGAYDDWRFGSARHLGEPPAGTWRLQVTDAVTGDTGTWQSWSLRLWGR